MGEVRSEADEDTILPEARRIGVCVGKGRSKGLGALKWAIENGFIPAEAHVYLLHVRPPVRLIPNPLGGKVPIEHVSSETVKKYKEDRLMKTMKRFDEYAQLCMRHTITYDVCYSENDSVHQELLNQISKLMITDLLLEKPSQSFISRVVGSESISSYLSKNAPSFCKVVIIRNNRLYSTNDSGSSSSGPSMSSPAGSMKSVSMASDSSTRNANIVEVLDVSEFAIPHDIEITSQRSFTESSTLEVLSSRNSLQEIEYAQADLKPDFQRAHQGVVPSSGFEFSLLQHQVTERNLSHCWSQGGEAPEKFQMAEEMVETAMRKVAEYQRQRDAALCEAKTASYRAFCYQKELEELTAVAQLAFKDREILDKKLHEEISVHNATKKELETTRRTLRAFVRKAEIAVKECQIEKSRCEEVSLDLKEHIKELERKLQLRKVGELAEEMCSEGLASEASGSREVQNVWWECSFEEIQKATENFSEKNKLGYGTYGQVYKGTLRQTTVAVKVLAQEGILDHAEFQKKIKLMTCLHHPHLVMLLGACLDKGCLIYEYMNNGSLEQRLYNEGVTTPLPWFTRFRICLEVARALLFLHSYPQPIVHKNLKLSNVLLDHQFVSKLTDTRMVEVMPSNSTSGAAAAEETQLTGKMAYVDPDYQRTAVWTCDADVYSLGVLMLQLLTKRSPLGIAALMEKVLDSEQLDKVLDKSAGKWPLREARAVASLGLRCMNSRPEDRPTLSNDVLPVLESVQKASVGSHLEDSTFLTTIEANHRNP
ncbi:hypothetical protein KP509_15G025700 [Ceratopteris richardii]|uniref:RING-type E3 ubiquitin transferase n=1 Tax=Ceratopteris richardii TaxID=49495 RepID=A0A8T2T686_CERRI|nr:hypothetical protein KP509_15G025700 [Ceratopteris richardii]